MTGIIETVHRWLDHFDLHHLDQIVSHMIRLRRARADSNPQILYGKMKEEDYLRLQLHYFIEVFTRVDQPTKDEKHYMSELRTITSETYHRLIEVAELDREKDFSNENYGGSA